MFKDGTDITSMLRDRGGEGGELNYRRSAS